MRYEHEGMVNLVVNRMLRRSHFYRGIPPADLLQAGRMGALQAERDYNPACGARLLTCIAHGVEWEVKRQYGIHSPYRKDPVYKAWALWGTWDAVDPCNLMADVIEKDERAAMADRVRRGLQVIDQRKADAIRWRYGIDAPECTLDELGKHLGVTREQARQIGLSGQYKLSVLAVFEPDRKARAEWARIVARTAFMRTTKARAAAQAGKTGMRLTGDRATNR